MPTRLLREGILDSRAINELSDTGEIFYRRLMSLVDDFGRYEADPVVLRGKLFSRSLDRWPLSRVSDALSEVGGVLTDDRVTPLVLIYDGPSGKKYLQVSNFGQRIRSIHPSRWPNPPSYDRTPLTDDRAVRPKTESETKTETESNAEAEEFRADLAFENIWLAYPVKGRTKRPVAEAQFVELILSATDRPALAAEILAAIDGKWRRSKLWADGFVTSLDKFLREHRWKEDPEPAGGGDDDRIPEYKPDWLK